MEGPPKAQVDPAPLGPKERKLKREELALYQFIASGQKVSPLAGSRCWCHDSLDATESISGRLAQSRHDTFTFYRHSNLQRKLPTWKLHLFEPNLALQPIYLVGVLALCELAIEEGMVIIRLILYHLKIALSNDEHACY